MGRQRGSDGIGGTGSGATGDGGPITAETMMSADLDAYRRHRAEGPVSRSDPLLHGLAGVRASSQPRVMFSRLIDLCVPAFCDGCEIELADGVEEPLRVRSDTDPAGSDEVPAAPLPESVHVPFEIETRDGYPACAGMVTFWWHHRSPTEADVRVAELLVRQVVALVEHHRLGDRVAAAESRAAVIAMQAIVSRQINLAVGIMMATRGGSADEAEDELREAAADQRADLFTVAAAVVRGQRGRPEVSGLALPGGRRHTLRSVPPAND